VRTVPSDNRKCSIIHAPLQQPQPQGGMLASQ
jgi:hypothetical protein